MSGFTSDNGDFLVKEDRVGLEQIVVFSGDLANLSSRRGHRAVAVD